MSRKSHSGQLNRRVGWVVFLIGILGGMVMGMWSFDGPVSAPAALADYSSLPRRLTRLAHIAAMALGMMNILYGIELPRVRLSRGTKKLGAWSMVVAATIMPLALTLAAFVNPDWKYLLPVPATASLVGVLLVVIGINRTPEAA